VSAARRLRVGRIPYINCFPVYGAVDRGMVPLDADVVDGVPTTLNRMMAAGDLDVSVVSAVEYARDWERYLLLPDLAISCDGPVRSVMLFSDRPATQLGGQRVVVSRSSMTSVYLLQLLFEHVWRVRPEFVAGDAEAADLDAATDAPAARLVIGDAALMLASGALKSPYAFHYDLGAEWKAWTGLPFVFAVWVANRETAAPDALRVNWGLAHLGELAADAARRTGVSTATCSEYFAGLDYGLSYPHLGGLTEFYRRLTVAGHVSPGRLAFLSAA
jgi:chorismate dehydratase